MFDNINDRQDYLSVDKTTAISSHEDIFHVGDVVHHDGAPDDETATIERFELDVEDNSILAYTTRGSAHISFLYHHT